ncbi:uncharacterized protein LOC143657699 [Tamandua tetradactyla]|uniref:uncharacterized protein LOC143657699 n=1 Tax=Tamandua tetradactyla TaxID=48850 RepID=UPI004053C3DE
MTLEVDAMNKHDPEVDAGTNRLLGAPQNRLQEAAHRAGVTAERPVRRHPARPPGLWPAGTAPAAKPVCDDTSCRLTRCSRSFLSTSDRGGRGSRCRNERALGQNRRCAWLAGLSFRRSGHYQLGPAPGRLAGLHSTLLTPKGGAWSAGKGAGDMDEAPLPTSLSSGN